MANRTFHPKSLPYLGAVLVAGLILITTETIVFMGQDRQVERAKSNVVDHLATVRARLEREINTSLHLTRGLVAYVGVRPEFTQQEFDNIAAELIFEIPHVRNIGLAPDNVISYVFPLAGNEKALGIKYEKLADQWPSVKRAIDSGETVVGGPVNLVQGGSAFIARTPIYRRLKPLTESRTSSAYYWGIASIVLDTQSILEAAGLAGYTDELRFAIRGKDALGSEGEVFFGDPQIFSQQPVLQFVSLPNGYWQIAAVPYAGWDIGLGYLWWYRIAGWMAAASMAWLFGLLIRERQLISRWAMHDSLTGLPNRRLFNVHLDYAIAVSGRSNQGFSLLYLDLNNFKPINDQYGHDAGDVVLKNIAQQMNNTLRQTDTIARVGGDEFIIILAEVDDKALVWSIAHEVLKSIATPINHKGQSLTVHASIGIARYPQDGDTPLSLIRAADQAMYNAKKSAQDQLVFAS